MPPGPRPRRPWLTPRLRAAPLALVAVAALACSSDGAPVVGGHDATAPAIVPATPDGICQFANDRERMCTPVTGRPECEYNEMYNRCRAFADAFRPEALQVYVDCANVAGPCTLDENQRKTSCAISHTMALPATDAQKQLLTPLCNACPGVYGADVAECLDTFLGRGDGGDIAGQFRIYSEDFIRQVVDCALAAAQTGDCHGVFMCLQRDSQIYRPVCGDSGA